LVRDAFCEAAIIPPSNPPPVATAMLEGLMLDLISDCATST